MKTLAAGLVLALSTATCTTAPDPRGQWTGYLLPPFDAIPIGLEVTGVEDGALTGAFLAPEVGYPSVPLGDLCLARDTLVATLADPLSWVAFRGRLTGDLYEGVFDEAGGSTPFALARAGSDAARALDARAAAHGAAPDDAYAP